MGSIYSLMFNRQRLLVLLGLAAVCVLAWTYTIWFAPDAMQMGGKAALTPEMAMPMEPSAGMGATGHAMSMAIPQRAPWNARTLALTFAMWVVMMVAMMLPSAAPMIVMFHRVAAERAARRQPAVPTAVFLAGYLSVWCGFSVLATAAQWALHEASLLSPMLAAASPWLGGGLLAAAGVFQFTPLKQACLAKCRSPIAFLLGEWREGVRGALAMGIRHGVYCTGCCWALMALLFVGGVMNLVWVAALAVVVLGEKALPNGALLGKLGGLALIAWGAWVMASGAF